MYILPAKLKIGLTSEMPRQLLGAKRFYYII